jgi:deoxyadenosine/deoxycytidine kinase
MLIAIEGNIGTGKTTIIEYLKKTYQEDPSVIFIEEPLEQWLNLKDTDGQNILGKFYGDPERWSYSFQMHAFITRAKDILSKDTQTNTIIIERSIMTDRNVFTSLLKDSGKVSELEWQLYEEWFSWLTDHFKSITPNGYIYLKADPNISYQRMVNRTREEEQSVPLEYIKSVSDKHDKWLLETESSPVETIEVNRDFVNDAAFRDAVMDTIGAVINSNRPRIASSDSEKSFEELLDAVCR